MTTVAVSAPVRVCDCGGWSDTWFARRGAVLHVAVQPGVEVRARAELGPDTVHVHLESYQESYAYPRHQPPGQHPLIEAAVAEFPLPAHTTLWLTVASQMPPGASTGTSAALLVGVISALRALRAEHVDAAGLAAAGHRLETGRLHLQSGVQDHIAAAYGGINFVEIDAYPHSVVTSVAIDPEVRLRLADRLALIYLGRAHRSSTVHEEVIAAIDGRQRSGDALDTLRQAALAARDALIAGDLNRFGDALRLNTEGQARLHPTLVSADARQIGHLADALGASGWKVNGAGGDGGSVTVVLGENPSSARADLKAHLAHMLPSARIVPIQLADRGATPFRV